MSNTKLAQTGPTEGLHSNCRLEVLRVKLILVSVGQDVSVKEASSGEQWGRTFHNGK